MRRSVSWKIISFLLIISLLSTTLYGCAKTGEGIGAINESEIPEIEIDTDAIVEETVEAIIEQIENTPEEEHSDIEEVVEEGAQVQENEETEEWEAYVGDFETFTYGLVVNQISYCYDTFPAYVRLSNGLDVSGIGYTDYKECYVNDDETECIFLAGFIPYSGEISIPESEFDEGLELYNLDYQDDIASFVYAYKSESFVDHCVVYGDYLKYGVDDEGMIFYDNQEFSRDIVDESIGSLYSYDESKYLLDLDVGNYIGLTGKSLYDAVDYDELEKEINRILDEQDYNFSDVDIESCAYFAQDAVKSFLLSLQEETFLGYDVDELVQLASELDPLECYRLTDEGMLKFNVEELDKPSSLCKWIVGSTCAVLAIVGAVASCVFVECPALSAAAGAVSGIAVEIFLQVVLENKKFDSVNWLNVALSAATGAVSGYLGPYVFAQYGAKFGQYFVVDSLIDGLLGGTERAVIALIDGGDLTEIAKSFGWGFATGAALSAAFKAAGKIVEKVSSAVSKGVKRLAPKLCAKVSKVLSPLNTIGEGIGKRLQKFKELADSSVFHSEYISRKLSNKTLERLVEDGSDELVQKSLNALKKADILDADGNKISKKALKELFDKADDGDILGHFNIDGEVVNIIKKNGAVGVIFDPSKYQTVTLPKGLIDNRDINFEEAAKLLKKSWLEDPSMMPDSIAKMIKETGTELEDMEASKLVDIIQKSDFVMHENLDLETITLVARKVHDKAIGGIAHMGGYALAKFIKEEIGKRFFDRFLASASTMAVEVAS